MKKTRGIGLSPYAIVIHAAGFRIDVAGPLRHVREPRARTLDERGYIVENGVFTPYFGRTEAYATARYAIVAPDGAELACRLDAELFESSWMGTWGGTTVANAYAVIEGRPAARFGSERAWIPAGETSPEEPGFAPFVLPVAAIVEFERTGVAPDGWAWDTEARVLSRTVV